MDEMKTPLRACTGVLSALAGGSILWGLSLALTGSQVYWGLIGFEVVILASAVFGLLVALGVRHFKYAPGMTLICVAGCIFVSAGMGLVALGISPGAVLRHPLFLLRFAIVGGFTGLSVLVTLGSNRSAWKQLIQGGVLSVLSVAVIGAGLATKATWLAGGRFWQLVLVVVSLVLLTALGMVFCVGVHLIIRAFERAGEPAGQSS